MARKMSKKGHRERCSDIKSADTDSLAERRRKREQSSRSTLKAIGSYIFFWPSIRKYAIYIKCWFSKKEKKKYDYWR